MYRRHVVLALEHLTAEVHALHVPRVRALDPVVDVGLEDVAEILETHLRRSRSGDYVELS